MITLIACTEINMGIGDENNDLLFKFPKDLQRFREITEGHIVVMGRKTWDSLPKKPLDKRKNYILTRDKTFSPKGGASVKVIHSIDDVIKLGKVHDVYVMGGGEIYEQLIPHADRLLLTQIHTIDYRARVFFPDVDVREWKLTKVETHKPDDKNPHRFAFATYERAMTREEIIKRQSQDKTN